LLGARPPRLGTGFDVHAFEDGDGVTLCGVTIPHSKKLAGHSDADVAWHALTDAILGAAALGDIGDHFPPSDPQWSGADSAVFLEHAVKIAADAGFELTSCDLTVICEAPKVKPHREAMRARTAEVTGLPISAVSVKATTTEGLGFTGRGEGIAAQAGAVLSPTR
jgi:2-C-methyl-D-erythritol 4-phosphate cytidylyltransferase/2-C-methyl-D-erythritol 2,4-cyclodiphosphate synthase